MDERGEVKAQMQRSAGAPSRSKAAPSRRAAPFGKGRNPPVNRPRFRSPLRLFAVPFDCPGVDFARYRRGPKPVALPREDHDCKAPPSFPGWNERKERSHEWTEE